MAVISAVVYYTRVLHSFLIWSSLVAEMIKFDLVLKHCKVSLAASFHRHLSNIDCLMARTACLVCFISTVNGRSKKKKKKRQMPWKMWRS